MNEEQIQTEIEIAIQFLQEALTGQSPRSKNSLIKSTIEVLEGIKK